MKPLFFWFLVCVCLLLAGLVFRTMPEWKGVMLLLALLLANIAIIVRVCR